MKKLLSAVAVGIALLALQAAFAEPSQPSEADMAALKKTVSELKPRSGSVVLKEGLATITVPEGLQYLDQKDSQTLLVQIWGNPAASATHVLGMVIQSPEAIMQGGWGMVITYREDGHVDDADAEKIDFEGVLKQMKEGVVEANKERAKNGYPAVNLVGWAEPPHYDPSTHKIYWAKDLVFADNPEHTLNYCTRILGRRGVLEFNAVAPVESLSTIRNEAKRVLAGVDFNSGNRYADFNKSTDKLATYGLAALVAGGIAGKMGLFKMLFVALLAAKKLVVVGVMAIVAAIKKFFARKEA